MADPAPFFPNRAPAPPRQAQPGERLFEFVRGRRFDTRALAVQWAEHERRAIDKGGAGGD